MEAARCGRFGALSGSDLVKDVDVIVCWKSIGPDGRCDGLPNVGLDGRRDGLADVGPDGRHLKVMRCFVASFPIKCGVSHEVALVCGWGQWRQCEEVALAISAAPTPSADIERPFSSPVNDGLGVLLFGQLYDLAFVTACPSFLTQKDSLSFSVDNVSWTSSYSQGKLEMADRRDWGGGGDDPEENTQRIIERIWESLTDIRMRMDQ
ncbi:hypothetical protein Taro_022137 [Colocasia esculenta]|uniref:Uncharacterized protein n=1 Tax=Colocasia esculenta TaxID=4460 RepID=A0A843V0W1_COLES|nr:hypothetical protein [Colocasia esculenta]